VTIHICELIFGYAGCFFLGALWMALLYWIREQ
jgi:hypothetical protein